ncbi:M15 family metallopeptidase [Flavobacteriaceae bacterium]|nr:M15 family metallopeptidase [Flavobacteriaceae bacterium]
MNRFEFISSLISLPLLNFCSNEKFGAEILIGKGKPNLVGKDHRLLPEVEKAYQNMERAARAAGIKVKVVSSYRSYEKQKAIWNRKFNAFKKEGLDGLQIINKIIEYSTIPGTSRHHWGTEIDVIDSNPLAEGDVLLTEKFHDGGPYEKLRIWMDKNAQNFGFIRPYTLDKERSGFYYEPWHYSFSEISKPMLKSYLKLDIVKLLKDDSLLGSEMLDAYLLNKYLESHVLGIDPSLL